MNLDIETLFYGIPVKSILNPDQREQSLNALENKIKERIQFDLLLVNSLLTESEAESFVFGIMDALFSHLPSSITGGMTMPPPMSLNEIDQINYEIILFAISVFRTQNKQIWHKKSEFLYRLYNFGLIGGGLCAGASE